MTFETEEVRARFHELPAQRQLEYCELEIYLARQGKTFCVIEILENEKEELDVIIRIADKFN